MSSRSLPVFLLLALVASSSCKSERPKQAETREAPPSPASKPSPGHPASASAIEWIENDYPRAMAAAKADNKPLVIDMWADWCHTCVAMQTGTLRDAGLSEQAAQFVWLAVDTEDPSSADVMAKFTPKVWPTFFVVSPVDESVQATQLGSCSVSAFRDFLVRGQHGHLAQLGDTLAPDSALYQLREGDRLWTQSKYTAAAAAYGRALEAGGPTWAHAAATINRRISALAKLDDKLPCATLAVSQIERMTREHNSAGADFMDYAGTCADSLVKAAKPDQAKKLREQALAGLDAILADPEAALSTDDRSAVLLSSRTIAEALNLPDKALDYARAQKAVLAKGVKEARSPTEEMTYVWHQVELHNYLNEGEAILPWVESLEQRLPNEYDPPYRKAWLLFQMKRYDEAHKALEPALRLAMAARKGRMLALDAAIYHAEGNTRMERKLRQATVDHYQGLAEGQASAKNLSDAQAALAAMDTQNAPAPL